MSPALERLVTFAGMVAVVVVAMFLHRDDVTHALIGAIAMYLSPPRSPWFKPADPSSSSSSGAATPPQGSQAMRGAVGAGAAVGLVLLLSGLAGCAAATRLAELCGPELLQGSEELAGELLAQTNQPGGLTDQAAAQLAEQLGARYGFAALACVAEHLVEDAGAQLVASIARARPRCPRHVVKVAQLDPLRRVRDLALARVRRARSAP